MSMRTNRRTRGKFLIHERSALSKRLKELDLQETFENFGGQYSYVVSPRGRINAVQKKYADIWNDIEPGTKVEVIRDPDASNLSDIRVMFHGQFVPVTGGQYPDEEERRGNFGVLKSKWVPGNPGIFSEFLGHRVVFPNGESAVLRYQNLKPVG